MTESTLHIYSTRKYKPKNMWRASWSKAVAGLGVYIEVGAQKICSYNSGSECQNKVRILDFLDIQIGP